MATNTGKRSPMKIFMGGTVLNTDEGCVEVLEMILQDHYNQWLGFKNGEPNLKVGITELEKKEKYRFDFTRHFGNYYGSRLSNDCIFSYDKQFILGEKYQKGMTADLDLHEGMINHYFGVEDVFDWYKKAGKPYHVSRVKSFEYEQIDRDHISLTITRL